MATLDLGKIKQVWRGTYNNSTAYTVDDLVEYTDSGISSTYICVANSTGNAPSSSGTAHASWNYVAKGVADPIPSQSGNSGKVLKTDGSSVSWGTDVGGKILQIVQTETTTTVSTSGSTPVDYLSHTITPSATSSKVLILIDVTFHVGSSLNAISSWYLFRGDSSSGTEINQNNHGKDDSGSIYGSVNMQYLDSPNTTSAQLYTLRCNRGSQHTTDIQSFSYKRSMTLMEIAA